VENFIKELLDGPATLGTTTCTIPSL